MHDLSPSVASDYLLRMQPKVVVIGSFNQDLTWRCAEFPAPGETIVGDFQTGPGGKGSNQAVAAARAGASTAFVGAFGDDAFGREAQAFLRAEGITVHASCKKRPTGNAAILVNRHGQNQIVVALGANAALAPRDVPSALLRSARVVVCQHETNLPLNAAVLRAARRAGVTTVLNPAPMRADFNPAVLAHTDILVPNETEFVALVGRRDFDEAALKTLAPASLHALCRTLGVPTVIVTLGSRGCFISEATRGTFVPAYTGLKVIDTTGAGDAFVGGFAAGLVKFSGDQLAATYFANAVAALSVTKFGTAPSMPTERAIRQFIKKHARASGHPAA